VTTVKNITVSVPEDVYRAARVRAAERGRSVSALVADYQQHGVFAVLGARTFHGTADQSIEMEKAEKLCRGLAGCGCSAVAR